MFASNYELCRSWAYIHCAEFGFPTVVVVVVVVVAVVVGLWFRVRERLHVIQVKKHGNGSGV